MEDEGGDEDENEEDDSEEGYNTSDIEALEDADTDAETEDEQVNTPGTSYSAINDKSAPTLDDLIARHTSKPDESEFGGIGSSATGGRALEGDGRWGTGKFSSAKEGAARMKKSKFVKGSFVREYDEIEAGYGSESSTEENTNTIGNVPIEWYDDLPHIGYSVDGKKIMRPAKGDELDKFLATVEDPDSW